MGRCCASSTCGALRSRSSTGSLDSVPAGRSACRSPSTRRRSACSCQTGCGPERVYAGDGGYWLRYRGLLLFEFKNGEGPEILKKAAVGTTDVENVDVEGEPGIWIGGRHALYLPGGPPQASGHALIWQHGGLTLRLEAAVGREQALAIARSVR